MSWTTTFLCIRVFICMHVHQICNEYAQHQAHTNSGCITFRSRYIAAQRLDVRNLLPQGQRRSMHSDDIRLQHICILNRFHLIKNSYVYIVQRNDANWSLVSFPAYTGNLLYIRIYILLSPLSLSPSLTFYLSLCHTHYRATSCSTTVIRI